MAPDGNSPVGPIGPLIGADPGNLTPTGSSASGTCAKLDVSKLNVNAKWGAKLNLVANVRTGGLLDADNVNAEVLLLLGLGEGASSATLQVCNISPLKLKRGNADNATTTIKLSPASLASAVPSAIPVSVAEENGCLTIRQKKPYQAVLGAKLSNPTDPLPDNSMLCNGVLTPCQDATAAPGGDCVCKGDNNDIGGVELEVENVPILSSINRFYAVFRANVSLVGRLLAADHIEGSVDAVFDQKVFACRNKDNTRCGDLIELLLKGIGLRVLPSPLPNTFVARALPPDIVSCEQLISISHNIFGN
jgi:hypothetical protein